MLRCKIWRSAFVICMQVGGVTLAQVPPALTDRNSWAFEAPTAASGNALLDLRSLNEASAGEKGFVRLSADGNSFVRGDGQPLRFWAVTSDLYHRTPGEMQQHARFLAKMGVNMVRLHTQISSAIADQPITSVNPAEIDGVWRMVAALKKEGIYVTISPYWATGRQAGKWGIAGYSGQTDLWGLLFFNETLQAGYKAWVRALYAPTNPYTGLPLAQDPAVAIIQIQNEDGMFFWTMGSVHPEQQKLLSRKFTQWLTAKYGSVAKAKAAWGNATIDGDDFAGGTVAVDFTVWKWTQPQAGGAGKRLDDQMQFLAETQRQFYTQMASYYRKELGCQQLINASNWITADPIRLNDLERWTNTANDVIAVNKYYSGVHVGDQNGWRIDPGHCFTAKPAVLNPRDWPTNLKQPAGHPMIITESSWVAPEPYQNEGPLLMAAYQSVTGVDAFYWFYTTSVGFETQPYADFLNINGRHPMFKWSCSVPAIMGNFPAAALIYRKGFLKASRPVVHEERPLTELWQRKLPRIAEDASFDPNRNSGNAGAQSNVEQGIDPLAFLVGPVDVKYGGIPAKNTGIDLKRFIDTGAKRITSESGEVVLDYANGLCTFDAPMAQGAVGFIGKPGEVQLSSLTLRSTNEHSAVAAVAMDDRPLTQSSRILLQVGTTVRPTGWQQETADFPGDNGAIFHGYKITSTGSMPWRIANTDLTATLANDRLTGATVLDAAGYSKGEIVAERTDGKLKVTLPKNAMYVLLH